MSPLTWPCVNRFTRDIPQKTTWLFYQTIASLKTHILVFFVRCAESVPCLCCGEQLSVIGSRQRKYKNSDGETKVLIIRRLRCTHCRRIHHELPNCLVPYKRYESACIERVVLKLPTRRGYSEATSKKTTSVARFKRQLYPSAQSTRRDRVMFEAFYGLSCTPFSRNIPTDELYKSVLL